MFGNISTNNSDNNNDDKTKLKLSEMERRLEKESKRVEHKFKVVMGNKVF